MHTGTHRFVATAVLCFFSATPSPGQTDTETAAHLSTLDYTTVAPTAHAQPRAPANSVLTLDDPEVADMFVRLSGDVPVRHHHYRVGSGESGVAGGVDPESIAYSNTPPTSVFLPPGTRLIADDVLSIAVGGCNVTGYELVVRRSLGECDGLGTAFCDTDDDCPAGQSCVLWADQSFSVDFAMWDDCPGNVDAQIIPGTEGTIQFPDAGVHAISVAIDPAVTVGQRYWVSTQFNAPGAGWVIGTPAQIGYTENVYHFHISGFFCVARTGRPDIYAGMSLRTFCELPFEREFLAYLNPELDGPQFQPGADQWLADDVELIVDDCTLRSLEIGAVGLPGQPFTIDVEVWQFCNPSTLIEGTQQTKVVPSDGSPVLVRFDYPGGLELPAGDNFWVAWRFNNASSAIIAGQAALGFTDNLFGLSEGGQCDFHWFGADPWAGFTISLRCLGEAPLGACCDLSAYDGGPPDLDLLCREVKEIACQGSLTRYARGATCDDAGAFDPPCGYSACCEPTDVCTDRPFVGDGIVSGCSEIFDDSQPTCRFVPDDPEGGSGEACNVDGDCPEGQICSSNPAMWQAGLDCSNPDVECPQWACRYATGDCCTLHDSVGCDGGGCCVWVCDVDAWCCTIDWDAVCVAEAKTLCPPDCPGGDVVWHDPPNGVVDARQPHAVDDATALQGIDTFVVDAPPGASACCWTVCEAGEESFSNAIAEMTVDGGTYTIRLEHPVKPGGIITLTYEGTGDTAVFTSHPGNVNGDQQADAADVLALIDELNGVSSLPWGSYSCDLDHSGACGPPDILRLIDLLNGAGAFAPWNGTELPDNAAPCP